MKNVKVPLIIINYLLLELAVHSSCFAYKNPLLTAGKNQADGLLGSFSQNNTGDCFFLASVIAIAQDSDGQALIESAFDKVNSEQWKITFPGLADQVINITRHDIKEYRLTDSDGQGVSESVIGDPDLKILEIAADKYWKGNIKSKGLWDDVPMNALYMFSKDKQLLLWNRAKGSKENNDDIDKYKRIPAGIIQEIDASSVKQVTNILKAVLSADKDGISMILIDYINYHAVAITNIDFDRKTYSYIDTTLITHQNQSLDELLQGLSSGQFAVNYLEI